MKASTKLILAGTAAIVAAAAIFGTVQIASAFNQLAAPVKHGISLSTPAPTATATKAPVVVDPVVAAQTASGLTAAQYQAVTAQVATVKAPGVPFQAVPASTVRGAIARLEVTYGKPVVVVVKTVCPASDNPGAISWEVTGAAYASAPGCGAGYQASRETAIAKVAERLNDKGIKAGGYVLVFVDWTN
jgi:hypothetical protein